MYRKDYHDGKVINFTISISGWRAKLLARLLKCSDIKSGTINIQLCTF